MFCSRYRCMSPEIAGQVLRISITLGYQRLGTDIVEFLGLIVNSQHVNTHKREADSDIIGLPWLGKNENPKNVRCSTRSGSRPLPRAGRWASRSPKKKPGLRSG